MLLLQLGALPFLWNYTSEVMKKYGYDSNEYGVTDLRYFLMTLQITHAIVFTAYASLYTMLTSMPFDIYDTFVIEERFGFNKQTWKVNIFFAFLTSLDLHYGPNQRTYSSSSNWISCSSFDSYVNSMGRRKLLDL